MEYNKQGYLNSEFRLFHIIDKERKEFDFHYHDFDKLVITISGNVSYSIEGKTYKLKPYDLLLVQHNEIHKPIIHDDEIYERIIVYISPEFLEIYRTNAYDLGYCFKKAVEENTHLIRLPKINDHPLFHAIRTLEKSFENDKYASELERKLLFLELMIELNRASLIRSLDYVHNESFNPKVLKIIEYIQDHLTEDINIDTIAAKTYMSRYHMMRTFKAETGYTIHEYISQKRLILAKKMLCENVPVTEVCYNCGFKDYTSFLRAYKKQYKELPSSARR